MYYPLNQQSKTKQSRNGRGVVWVFKKPKLKETPKTTTTATPPFSGSCVLNFPIIYLLNCFNF